MSLSNTLDELQDTIVTETVEVVDVTENNTSPHIVYIDDQQMEEEEEEEEETVAMENVAATESQPSVENDSGSDPEPVLPSVPAPMLVSHLELEDLIVVSSETVVNSEPLVTLNDLETVSADEPTQTLVTRVMTPPPAKEEPSSIIKNSPNSSPKSKPSVKSRVSFDLNTSTIHSTPKSLDTSRNQSYSQKAKAFSEIINEPPKITIKATTKEVSEERLRQMHDERKAIIKMSMKGGDLFSDEEEQQEGR